MSKALLRSTPTCEVGKSIRVWGFGFQWFRVYWVQGYSMQESTTFRVLMPFIVMQILGSM